MPTRNQAQLALDETVMEMPELEQMLDDRQRKDSMSALRLQYEDADKAVAAEVEKLELPEDTAVRIGRWRITRVHVPARSVPGFDTKEKNRVKIDLAEDE